MIRKLLFVSAGAVLAVLGLIGLVLPVLPGVLLLAAAAGCLSLGSQRLRRRIDGHLQHSPRYQRALRRWRAGAALPALARLRLGFWLTLAALVPAGRR